MSAGSEHDPKSFFDQIEETLIAVILGLMTVITFANVVMRYVFNSNILWALETTVFLFAWLVLLGASYAVKKTMHLGVDALLALFSPAVCRVLALLSAAVCLAYAFLLLKGGWDYWANFANLPATTGRWFPMGFEEMRSTNYRAWYEVNDIPMPDMFRFIEGPMNEGEAYEKIPRFIPYAVLPIAMSLLLLRFVQATVGLWRGDRKMLIVSHEAEDAVEEARAKTEADDAAEAARAGRPEQRDG